MTNDKDKRLKTTDRGDRTGRRKTTSKAKNKTTKTN